MFYSTKKTAKVFLLIAFISMLSLLNISGAEAQDDVRRFRIGFKFGVPILAGGALEYVLPVANNRIGINGDFGTFNFSSSDASARYTYFSLGANYYLNKKGIGRGPYVGLSYGNLAFNFSYTNITSDIVTGKTGGVAEAKVNVPQVQIRLGLKTGKGAFYFCPEIGYGISSIPSSVTVNATFPNGTRESATEDLSGIPASALSLILNFTLGVTF